MHAHALHDRTWTCSILNSESADVDNDIPYLSLKISRQKLTTDSVTQLGFQSHSRILRPKQHRIPLPNAFDMQFRNMNGIWIVIFTFLAVSSNELVCGMRTSLSEEDNEMMEDGTFAYNAQSQRTKAVLFKDFVKTFSRQVIIARLLLNWCR